VVLTEYLFAINEFEAADLPKLRRVGPIQRFDILLDQSGEGTEAAVINATTSWSNDKFLLRQVLREITPRSLMRMNKCQF
jgi:hypothetical protein